MTTIHALLVVDVVDSTAMTQELGDEAMATLWAAHDRVARDLLAIWRGREIDKTDGFLLLFAAAADAAGFALAFHRALSTPPLAMKVRAGIHVGPVILRENSAPDVALGAKPLEVEGLAKSTTARLMSLAQGGQTLISAEARDALGATDLRVQSHGHWRMKGITEPVELFEIGDAGTRFAPPSDSAKVYRVVPRGSLWLPVRQIDNNLPQQVTSFIGRERELAETMQRLSQTRLLTLLGIGGLGKTRLSLQLAAAVMGDFPDGAWFVELAPLADERQVQQAVASALRVKEETGLTLHEALKEHVRNRQLLVVLDNCEHLLSACGTLASQLLQSGPGLKILATSREPLHVAGEVSYPIPTLAVPTAQATLAADSLVQYEAVRLFSERAKAVRPTFRLDAHNAPAVAEVCRRLDGIPLALELAAARIRALSVDVIAQRLVDRFQLLTHGDRTALPRQQTLRALIDWSHDLLSPPERTVLRRLAVFAGGCTLEAAEAVCAGAQIDKTAVLDLLTHLVDKSLVSAEASGERHRLLETVREYALEHLNGSGEAEDVRSRHLEYFLALAGRAAPELWGANQGAWVARLDLERENVLAAHAWCGHADDRAMHGLQLLGKLQLYWLPSGQIELGYRLLLEALARPGAQQHNTARCGAEYAASHLAYFMGRFQEVLAHGEQSLSIAREIGDRARAADALLMLGYAADELKQRPVAQHYFEQSISLARDLGDRARLSYALNALGGHNDPSDLEAAVTLYEESLALAREVGDRESVAITQQNLVRSLVRLRRGERAGEMLLESLEIGNQIGSKRVILNVLEACAVLASQREDWARAARFFGAANGMLERLSISRPPGEAEFLAAPIALAQQHLADESFSANEAAGLLLDTEQASAQAKGWLSGGI